MQNPQIQKINKTIMDKASKTFSSIRELYNDATRIIQNLPMQWYHEKNIRGNWNSDAEKRQYFTIEC